MDEPQTQHQEPSMEEILASIRRIISEDASDPPEEYEEPPMAAASDDDAEADPPPLAQPRSPELSLSDDEDLPEIEMADEDDDILELTQVVQQAPPPPPPMESGGRSDDGTSLISERTADLAQSAFARLNGSGNRLYSDLPIGDGRTVEDLVRELLKPMLHEWLDANLPDIVERLVDREVQYIGRGGGRR
ncbi:MAG: DUF2497 domain-containing protein [Rhodospirillaceae bacterium]|nr:DUF2497 domain-containing protein [Rhodospirillaceae bacterium]